MKIALTSVFVDDPIKAHTFYTEVLGFQTKQFDADAQLAIVVSAEDPDGTALLLEPHGASFAKEYQEAVYAAGLPVIVFGVKDVGKTMSALQAKGVVIRGDLDKPEWGLENILEDGFGNFIMISALESDY